MTPRVDDIGQSIREDGIVTCGVGDEQYALRNSDVRHILRAEALDVDAGTHGSVGTVRVEQERVPVFALRRVLQRPTRAGSAGHHIAVTGQRGAFVGWLVDRIVRTPIAEHAAIVALPHVVGTPATAWFDALIGTGDDTVLLLSPAALNPLAPAFAAAREASAVFVESARGTVGPEPMAVIFSTPALPASGVSLYALSGHQIAAIVQPLPLLTVPGSAPHVLGLAWWRQAIVPFLDFRPAAARTSSSRYLVAQGGRRPAEHLVALPIDADVRLHRASADDRPLLDAERPSFSRGVYGVNGEAVALLDLDALLDVSDAIDDRIPAS